MATRKKKKQIRIITLVISIMLMCNMMFVNALAENQTPVRAEAAAVTATLSPDFNIMVDGVARTFYNVSGQEVHPILYNGTTYLPIRAIGELMGKNVNWDQSALIVTLAGTRSGGATVGTPDNTAVPQNITVQVRPDFTIIVDDAVRTFMDANGSQVYPLLYNGSTYLPLRAVGNLMGKNVEWNANTKTVSLFAGTASGNLVTDADSFNTTGNAGSSANNGTVTTPTVNYSDTDYGPYNDGVTDYNDTDYGPYNDGVTDYNDTDYGPYNDGVTDYNDTDYGPYNDGVTDYNDTDYGPYNDGVTDYNDTDYGPYNDGVTDYSNYGDSGYSNYGNSGYSSYGDSAYD